MTESIATKIDPSLFNEASTSDTSEICMNVNKLSLFYGEAQALTDVSFQIFPGESVAADPDSGPGSRGLRQRHG